jgi:hypothetical protein
MSRKVLFGVVVIALLMSINLDTAHANLVVNGNFGTGDFTSWVTSDNFQGFNSVDALSGRALLGQVDEPASLSQIISTTTGQRYVLKFILGNSTFEDSPGPNSFQVWWGDLSQLSYQNASGFAERDFIYYNLLADSTSTKLMFTFQNDPGWWSLGEISASPVPIPGAVWLLGSGLLGLVGIRRKFHK